MERNYTTYRKTFSGTPEGVETAVKVFDKIFRARYNVYGGKRIGTYKNTEGEYVVVMDYIAKWDVTSRMAYLFPEYTPDGLEYTFSAWTRNLPDNDDWYFYCDTMKKIPTL